MINYYLKLHKPAGISNIISLTKGHLKFSVTPSALFVEEEINDHTLESENINRQFKKQKKEHPATWGEAQESSTKQQHGNLEAAPLPDSTHPPNLSKLPAPKKDSTPEKRSPLKPTPTKVAKPPTLPAAEPPQKEIEDSEGEGEGGLEVDEENDDGASEEKDTLEDDFNSLAESLTTQDPAKLTSLEASLKAAKERLKAELEELKAELDNEEETTID